MASELGSLGISSEKWLASTALMICALPMRCAVPSFLRFLLPPSFLFQSWLSLKSALGVGQMVNLFHICVVLHRSTQDNLMLILQVNNATQARIANCHYCEFDLHIEVDHPQSGIGHVLTAADMQYIPVQAPLLPPYKPSQFSLARPAAASTLTKNEQNPTPRTSNPMQVMKHDSGWTDLRLRVVGIAALREIHPGEELLSCYFTQEEQL